MYVVRCVAETGVQTRVMIGCLAPATQLFDFLTERSQQYPTVQMYEAEGDDRDEREKQRAQALLEWAFS